MKQIQKDPSFNIFAILAVGWLIVILTLFFSTGGVSGDYLLGTVLIFTIIFLVLADRAHQKYQSILQDYAELNQTKSEFTSVISHQLRTPIASARWNMELVLDGAYGKLSNPKIKQALYSVYKDMNSLNVGMDNLVTATEIQDHIMYNKPTEFDLSSEVRWLIKELSADAAAKKVKVEFDAEQNNNNALADKHKTYFIIKALLANAIAYSQQAKIVKIRLRRIDNTLVMTIANQGIKIDPKTAELVFDKYYRSEEAKQAKPDGLGLSLFIAKVFAEANDGKLYVSKNTGKQIEFTLKLPAAN